ncbi:MAG: integrin [Nannocystis sp.]|uniref:hypothetical protein n=1 Tax=Nannocystis sp. TaxID=1962667 RepID=UPI002420D515|nr:hypothetical protein [Nannocystis sp.]MBK9752000.1 integrin [Nannocystis sp.]
MKYAPMLRHATSMLLVAGWPVVACYSPDTTPDTDTDAGEAPGPDSDDTGVVPTGDATQDPTSGDTGNPGTSDTADTADPPAPDLPDAPTLHLGFSAIKKFDFSWTAVLGATRYELLERPEPGAGVTQLGPDIVGTAVSWTMPLHRRYSAQYTLRACNTIGCTLGAPVDVEDPLTAAIGYFKASNTDVNDEFGGSVALSADGRTLAVGAIREGSAGVGVDADQNDESLVDAGAVYVFTIVDEVWTQQAYVKAHNTRSGDFFGGSVALSADGSTLAVGAEGQPSGISIDNVPTEDGAGGAGAVYVFSRLDSEWAMEAYLKANTPDAGNHFGARVALAADGDTLAIGAPDDTNTGVVYVFTRSDFVWLHQDHFNASNPGNNDRFGSALALSSDGATIVVGASGEDSAATGVNGDPFDDSADAAGAAYVFVRDGDVWNEQAYLKASNTDPKDLFGYSVAVSADGTMVAIGGPHEQGVDGDENDDSGSQIGATYMFVRAGDIWSQQAYIKVAEPSNGDSFGDSVALSADGGTLVVGASLASAFSGGIGGDDGYSCGAAYTFARSADTWAPRAYIKSVDPLGGQMFGDSLAISGDGDIIAVGAPEEHGGATGVGSEPTDEWKLYSGAVYLY